MTLEKASAAYTGSAQSGAVKSVVLDGVTLEAGADYTVSAASGKDVGSYAVTVTGKGNYTGTATATFKITAKQIAKPTGKTLTYNGKAQVGVAAGTGYTVKNGSATNAGTYNATATLGANYKWSDGTTAAKTIKWSIAKAPNTMTASAKAASVKYSKVKKKAQTVKAITVKKAQGSVTYKKASGDKKLTISKAGKITVAKKAKKGTHKMKVKVTAAGNGNYKSASKTITVKVKVK